MILINFMNIINIKFLRCFIFNNFKFDIISYRNLKYMFRKWLVEVEAVSWVEILVGNIVHLWKGTKMEQLLWIDNEEWCDYSF